MLEQHQHISSTKMETLKMQMVWLRFRTGGPTHISTPRLSLWARSSFLNYAQQMPSQGGIPEALAGPCDFRDMTGCLSSSHTLIRQQQTIELSIPHPGDEEERAGTSSNQRLAYYTPSFFTLILKAHRQKKVKPTVSDLRPQLPRMAYVRWFYF